jgi:DNA-binding response OmpR family regulator
MKEEEILSLCVGQLSRNDFQISLARNGDEAISKFVQERPEIVVLEYELPKENGLDVACEILAMRYSTKVIMFASDRKAIQKAERIGAEILLIKPFAVSRLIEAAKAISKVRLPVSIIAR